MAGLGISTNKLVISAWDFFPASGKFSVNNPNPQHIGVKISAEGGGSGWIKFNDQNLVLSPNESREVTLRVSAWRGGEFHPAVSIQEQALEGEEIGIAAGIKLPVEIHSRALTGPLLAATLILLCAVTIKYFRKQRFKKT